MPTGQTSHKASKLLLLTATALMANEILAGPPIPFDQFTVTSGDITALPCPTTGLPPGATITCGDLNDPNTIVSDGMLQRRITLSGLTGAAAVQNGTYIQFIITDPGVTGDATADPFTAARGNLFFTNEDFVKMNNRTSGISEKQVIIDSQMNSPDLETRFVNISEYEFGAWANTSGTTFPWIKLYQQISQLDYSDYNASLAPDPTLIFDSTADILSNGNGFNDNIKVTLEQDVDLTVDGSGAGAQGFKYVKAVGQYQTSSNPTDPMLPGGTNGGTVTWSPGDPVEALWIGQTLDQGAFGNNTLFGFTKYTATDSSGFFPVELTSSLTSFTDTTAVNWDLLDPNIFGLPPVVPAVPVLVAATAAVAAPDPIDPAVPAGTAPGGPTTPVTLPLNYYAWTVNNGVFSVDPCPATVTCRTPVVNEGGVFQRIVVVSGVEYMQTIITEEDATGDPNAAEFTAGSLAFKSENFVRLGLSGTNQGIASTLRIAQEDLGYLTVTPGALPSTAGQFVYNTDLRTGWANGGPLDPRISIDQRLVVPDTNFQHVSSFDYQFKLEQGETDLDKRMSIRHVVGTVTGGNGFDNPIRFDTEVVQGAFQNTSNTLAEPALLPSTGDTITWNPFDAVQVTWIGGEYITPDGAGPSRINTTSYINLTTGERAAATANDVSPPAPESWVDPFTQPPPSYSTTYTPPPF